MKRALHRVRAAVLLGIALAFGACSKEGNLGSETHWLMPCERDAECGSSLSCECGLCSTGCTNDVECATDGAVCSPLGAAAADALCEGVVAPPAGICLPGCADVCAADQTCLDGACVPRSRVEPVPPGEGIVELRALIVDVVPQGTQGITAEWINGTDQPVFLRGCATTDGWYFDGTDWQEHGALALCAAETPMVTVAPGETYVDPAGAAPPPDRGTNLWRLVGSYGVACAPADALFSEATCDSVSERTSTNDVTWTP